MATIFRRARPSRRFGGRRGLILSTPIARAAGSAAGIGAAAAVGIGIIAAAGQTDGSASVTAVGVGIIAAVGSTSGVATDTGIGSGYLVTVGIATGSSSAQGAAELKQIISTNMLQKPVDVVLAGQQTEYPGRLSRAAARHAFNE